MKWKAVDSESEDAHQGCLSGRRDSAVCDLPVLQGHGAQEGPATSHTASLGGVPGGNSGRKRRIKHGR